MSQLRTCVVFICAFLLTPVTALQAQNDQPLREYAILTTMTEAALATGTLLQDRADVDLTDISWTARFTDREWRLDAQGNTKSTSLGFTMTGYLWGEDQSDWTISFSGLGQLGEEAIAIHGQTHWLFDPELSDYRDMDFRQVVKFGTNTVWGWVLGAEVIIGGGIGATGGLVAGPAGSLGGAIIIGSAAVGMSSGAKYLLESDTPPDQPPDPERPAPPKEGEAINDSAGILTTAVLHDGGLLGSFPDSKLALEGRYSINDGYAEAKITRQ